MRFLPIVDRELREGSRRRGTYWLRVRVAFQALLIGVGAYFVNLFQPMVKLGTVLFWGLSGVSMIFCLLAGRRSTADCLSREKRDGTLGLLFLTDLKGYDVVLGKLAGTSIAGFYSLMTVFPVLAIPLLAGGMTNGEFWRMALVLVNTFFLSLAIGLFASALSREYRTAMALNFLMALLLAALPAACGMALLASPAHRFVPEWFYSCPIFSFIACADVQYTTLAQDFWRSLAVTHGLAWALTLSACWIVPRTWGDRPAPAPSPKWRWGDLGRKISYGSPAQCVAFRRRALNANAFYWLAARARLKPAQVWFFLAVATLWWFYGWFKSGAYWLAEATFIATAIILNSAFKLWLIHEAGQRLGEDRRSGAFELLLATPLTVRDVLGGQIRALRRQFFKPLLLVTALELALALGLAPAWSLKSLDFVTCLAGVCMLWADVAALTWAAMAASLTCKNQTQATAVTVIRILILPWVAFGAIMAILGLLYELDLTRWQPGQRFALGLWFGLGLAADLLFGWRGWRTMRKNFRQLAVQSFLAEPPRSTWRAALAWIVYWAGRSVPPRARKPVLACAAAGAALAAILLARPSRRHFPPPVVVSITQSNAPFQVFPGGGNGVFFVMPDRTLWQWGKPGAPQSPRAAVPEQIGTAHDWVKVVGAGTHCLGLRADGAIWGWGFSNGKYAPEPQPAIEGHDWVDLGTGSHEAAAIKRDGTLWTWYEPLVANNGKAARRGIMPKKQWIAVSCFNDSTFALRKDGTLWAWGTFVFGAANSFARIPDPTQLCRESNWTALDANCLARNQAGELWDVRNALPNPQAGAADICFLVSSNGPSDRGYPLAPWSLAQLHADGTLWTALPSSPSALLAGEWRQLGSRSDWVGAWGEGGTGFGLTAGGTLWTWGADLGEEPVKTYESRLDLLRERLTGGPRAAASRKFVPATDQPRPLLKMGR